MVEKQIESIRVIVKDNKVGVKMSCNGEMYGSYVKFDHFELRVSDVVESVNSLLEVLLKGVTSDG